MFVRVRDVCLYVEEMYVCMWKRCVFVCGREMYVCRWKRCMFVGERYMFVGGTDVCL